MEKLKEVSTYETRLYCDNCGGGNGGSKPRGCSHVVSPKICISLSEFRVPC